MPAYEEEDHDLPYVRAERDLLAHIMDSLVMKLPFRLPSGQVVSYSHDEGKYLVDNDESRGHESCLLAIRAAADITLAKEFGV